MLASLRQIRDRAASRAPRAAGSSWRTGASLHGRGLGLLAAFALVFLPGLAMGQDYERWYTLDMGGQRAGSMHVARTTTGELITSSSRMVLNISRGPISIAVTMEGEFIETAAGQPVSMLKREQMGNVPSQTQYTFAKDEMVVRSIQGDQVLENRRPLPEGNWLTPAAAEMYIQKRLEAGADSVVVRTLDPMTGAEPNIVKRTGIRPVKLEIMGQEMDVFRCNAETSSTPGITSTEFLDAGGIPVRVITSMMGLEIAMTMAAKDVAMAVHEGAGGGAEIGPELMERTFIRPSPPTRRIRNPRGTTSAEYILRVPEGEMPALPTTGIQRTDRIEDEPGAQRIIIDMRSPAPALPGDRENPVYLEASSALNAEDPEIRRLAREAIGERQADAAAAKRAEAMRRFVYRYIRSKDLDVGFATASEVARSRQGDCTEHAVLLAAMLRSDGIPSRVVSGLVYADQFAGARHIFGYHMWTQALVETDGEDRWVDLDATLERPFDATHIALSLSALRDGEMAASLSSMLPLIGRLEVKVERYE